MQVLVVKLVKLVEERMKTFLNENGGGMSVTRHCSN